MSAVLDHLASSRRRATLPRSWPGPAASRPAGRAPRLTVQLAW